MNLILFILLQQQISNGVGMGMMMGLAVFLLIVISSIPGVNIGFRVVGLPPINKKYRVILEKRFDFYTRLPAKQKKLFEGRVQHFINIKDFIPRKIDKVSEEMKALIAASAIQLTFGLPKIYLSHFKRILIYPDNYYSTINKVYHKGEVNPLVKTIVLSWNNFVKGYIHHDDGINLGLHEMAHALHLENYILNDEYQFFDKEDLERWNYHAKREINAMREGGTSIFRDYAAMNKDEFFAVVIENFFERSGIFADSCPELYLATVKLLNQDPLQLLTDE